MYQGFVPKRNRLGNESFDQCKGWVNKNAIFYGWVTFSYPRENPGDVELPEGSASEEFIESNNLVQLIDEPTNIRTTGVSCVELIITDEPNLSVDFGVHPSLDNNC